MKATEELEQMFARDAAEDIDADATADRRRRAGSA